MRSSFSQKGGGESASINKEKLQLEVDLLSTVIWIIRVRKNRRSRGGEVKIGKKLKGGLGSLKKRGKLALCEGGEKKRE